MLRSVDLAHRQLAKKQSYAGGCTLEAREQKRTKRGDWSKGRTVSLERLYNNLDAFDYLSPQDRRICQRIEAETVYEYFGRYPRTLYNLENDQALLEAVGHPLLFWANAPEQAVELVQGEPVLEVNRRKTQLQLRLQPYPPPSSSLPARSLRGQGALCLGGVIGEARLMAASPVP